MNMELNSDNAGQNSLVDLNNPLYKELYFLIAKFLSGGPCKNASEALIQELEANEIIPTSVNWLGETLKQDYRTFSSKLDHVTPDHLPKLLEQLVKTVNSKETSSKVTSRSLLSYSTLSLLSTPESPKKSSGFTWSKKYGQHLLLRPSRERKPIHNHVQALVERPLSGCGLSELITPEFYKRMGISCNTLGHLSAVYCVLFDNTGKYIFTGADDHLVKIWSAIDGRLVGTLRGTSSEVADLAINHENTLLAVASCDRLIRVWCLRTCAPVDVLSGHGGNVTSIFFCPIPRSRSSVRYLASTSTDGACAFWAYTDEPGERIEFQKKPTIYLEKMRPGHAQMICSSFSSGGIFMAAGSADNHVRVYHMLMADGPERILEVEHHTDRVDSISWAHEGVRFVSGSKDGTALIWRFENREWHFKRLYCEKDLANYSRPSGCEGPSKPGPTRVTMVGWNSDDSLVLTAVSDWAIKVWNSNTGELVRILYEHTDEVYVIEAHPFNPKIICTAGHDGKLIIWDIGTTDKEDKGGKVFTYSNQLGAGQGHGSLFDCKWSPDGFSIAATDSHGHLMVFTVEANKNKKKKLPSELFFHTDYRPIARDAVTNEIVDEQTQVPPHLMPPPFLVDVDGNPYPPNLQRLVPGRENLSEEYLIPNVAVSAGGYQEVIEGISARSNIDAMIQELAIAQGLQQEREREQNAANRHATGADRERRGVGLRRSGEVEGVRQSRGDWQTGSHGFSKRHVVSGLTIGMLARSEEFRLGCAELEENWYREHLTRKPQSSSPGYATNVVRSAVDSPEGRSRRIRRLALQAAERRQQQANVRADFYEEEGIARPNPRPQMEISVSQESPRRPLTTQSRRYNDAAANPNRRQRPPRYGVGRRLASRGESDVEGELEPIEVEDDSSSEAHVSMSSSESSSSGDSDSDWGGTLGTSKSRDREQENKKKSTTEGRKRSQRLNSNSSGSPERDEEQKETDGENEEEEEPKPGPSEPVVVVKTEPVKQSRARKARGKADYSGGLEEIPEQYRPCEWLAEVHAKRSPYFPQLGDDLVYYRQGHEAYIKEVEDKKMYEIPKKLKNSLPYVQKPDMEPEVSVRVIGIKFELEPPRLVALKLARTDWETGELLGENIYVKYHDVPDVVDFLIVRQMYEKSVRRRWNEGDKFRCLIQREWWLGTIECRQPFNKEFQFQDSNYLCYKVTWDNGDPERMSPWDMDIIPDDFETPDDHSGQDGIPASEEDLRIGLYEATSSDWPPHGHQDAQCQKISNLLEQVMGLAISEAFLTPVDLNLYPEYSYIINYPIDLSTIKSRVDNRFYRRLDALKFDVKYIALNAEKFNQLDSDIVKHSRVIRDLCLEIISDPDILDVNPVYHRIMKNKEGMDGKTGVRKNGGSSSKGSSKSEGRSTKGSTSKLGKSKKTRKRKQDSDEDSDEEDSTAHWQDRCLKLLNYIWHCKDAAPFREPVDIIENADYYHVVDTPMDLQTCKEELLGGNYESVHDFHKDMQMIFSNSRQYNTDKHSAIYSMTLRLQNMYECRITPILRSEKQRKSKRNTKSSSRSSRGTSPAKRSRPTSSRVCNSSANSTPRKNPKRSAAAKNPYVQNEDGDSSAHEDDNVGRRLRTRVTSKRGRSRYQNGNLNGGTRMNGHRHPSSTNGYFSGRRSTDELRTQHTRPRPVKKLRISSGSSHPSSPRRGMATRNSNTPSRESISPPSKVSKRHPISIKDEPESDEFEDSEEATMPTLNAVKDGDNDNDEDYNTNNSDNDSDDDEDHASLRRSTRTKSTRNRREEYHDGYGYETRYRGKHVQSYADHDASDEEDDTRHGKRRRVVSRRSPLRPVSVRGSPRQTIRPPVLRRSSHAISESEESQEDDYIDPDQPGPSSRLLRQSVKKNNTNKSKANGIRIRNELQDQNEEDVEDDEGDPEHDSRSEDSSSEEVDTDDEESGKRRTNGIRKPIKRRRHFSSDDEEYESAPARKRTAASSSSGRRATRGNRPAPDYAEESDSEPRISVSVSSRGRIRRTKSFGGE